MKRKKGNEILNTETKRDPIQQKQTHREHVRQKGDLARALAVIIENISDYLYASILLEESYPDAAELLERMGEIEVGNFHLLGSLMLKNGMNTSLKNIFRHRGQSPCPFALNSNETIRLFLKGIKERIEKTIENPNIKQSLWEIGEQGEMDKIERLWRREEEQLQRLKNLLS